VTFSGNTVTVNPTNDLLPGTDYYVVITSGSIQDMAGNSYAGLTAPTAFNFHTATPDTTAPLLTSSTPSDDATNVAVNSNIVLTFNEAVKAGSGNIEIHKADGSLISAISVLDINQVSFSGNTVTINPSSDLAYGTGYYIEVAAGAIRDLAGNNYPGLTNCTALNFASAPQKIVVTGFQEMVIALDPPPGLGIVADLTDVAPTLGLLTQRSVGYVDSGTVNDISKNNPGDYGADDNIFMPGTYTFENAHLVVPPFPDLAGNNETWAYDVGQLANGQTKIVADFVTRIDGYDFYKFTLTHPSAVAITLATQNTMFSTTAAGW